MSRFDAAPKTNEMARAAIRQILRTCAGTRAAIQPAMRLAVAAVLLVLSTSIAAAQAPGQTMSWEPEVAPPSTVQPQTMTVNYRSDVLLADGASIGLVLLAAPTHSPQLAAFGVSGFFLGAPIVHIAHGRGTAALESLGLRAGLPLVGAWIGYRVGPQDIACADAAPVEGGLGGGCTDQGSIVGMLLGGLAGGVSAMVIDAKFLAKYEKRTAPPSWTASIAPSHGGATVGVAGTF